VQTCKYFIKVLVRNKSVLNVRTSDFEDIDYNLKRDGWLTNFTDLKNQFIRDDGVLWRGARKKRPEFFSIIFSALMNKDNIILDWQCGVSLFFTFIFFLPLFFYVLIFCIWSILHSFFCRHILAYPCSRRFYHCMPLHSTPYCGA
jgi:hypothetical protein